MNLFVVGLVEHGVCHEWEHGRAGVVRVKVEFRLVRVPGVKWHKGVKPKNWLK